mmetsp:Transcript_11738/g.17782  ORF Transcript_11738/g.17782 Transcript_11738/m.17782 type:complete len:365 (+) Transcript_11738:58-1152(+)
MILGASIVAVLCTVSYLISYHVLPILNSPTPTLDSDISSLPEELRDWESKGTYHNIHSHRVFGMVLKPKRQMHASTYVLLHGYPSSSHEYSYGGADTLTKLGYNVVMHDHIGFGFSDKPVHGFGYSVQDHADVALAYWKEIGLSGDCLFVAHDMGDSILNEILARYDRDTATLPSGMRIKGVVFSNGGMSLQGANPRLSQRIMMSHYGEAFNKLTTGLDANHVVFRQQLGSVFASHIRAASGESSVGRMRNHQMNMMMDLLYFKGGIHLLWKTIRYIHDRHACEDRWLSALSRVGKSIPVYFLWGQDDAVAPPVIPHLVIARSNLTYSNGNQLEPTFLPKRGHFLMMEEGDGISWAEAIVDLTL